VQMSRCPAHSGWLSVVTNQGENLSEREVGGLSVQVELSLNDPQHARGQNPGVDVMAYFVLTIKYGRSRVGWEDPRSRARRTSFSKN